MSSWACIRKVTDEDYAELAKRAVRFAKRHNLPTCDYAESDRIRYQDIIDAIEYDNPYLCRLWTRVFRSAVNEKRATGIAYGIIGYTV